MVITKDLGAVSAYAYAVEQGYQGTEEEFAELMARQATVAEEAAASADAAAESASEAQASAEQAEQSAQSISGDVERAEQAATTATNKATEAAQSAATANSAEQTATDKASEASASATAAANSASAAATSESNAAASATAAQTAKTAAETAQGKAEDAQAAAEQAAQSVSASAAQIAKNTDNFASEFSTSTAYAIGDYCIHEGILYRFVNAHTGAWSASDVEETNVGGEIGDLKSHLNDASNICAVTKNAILGNKTLVTSTGTASVISGKNIVVENVPNTVTLIKGRNRFNNDAASFAFSGYTASHTLTKENNGIKVISRLTQTGTHVYAYAEYIAEYTGQLYFSCEAQCDGQERESVRDLIAMLSVNGTSQQQIYGRGLLFECVNVQQGDVVRMCFYTHAGTAQGNTVYYKNIMLAYGGLYDFAPYVDDEASEKQQNKKITMQMSSNSGDWVNRSSHDDSSLHFCTSSNPLITDAIDGVLPSNNNSVANVIVNGPLALQTYNQCYNNSNGIAVNTSGTVAIYYNGIGRSALATWLANNPVSITYVSTEQETVTVDLLDRIYNGGEIVVFSETTVFDYYKDADSKDCNVVCFGDSITGMFGNKADYPTMITLSSDVNAINAGFSGSRWTDHSSTSYLPFSMNRLADAVTSGDYSLQDASPLVNPESSSYNHLYAEHLANLKAINWHDVDFVTLFWGTNDYLSSVIIKSDDDPATSDKQHTNVEDAVRYTITKLLTAYPWLRIIVLTPYWMTRSGVDSDVATDSNGKYMIDFCNTIEEVAKDEFHLPTMNQYRTLGVNMINKYYFEKDDAHPTERLKWIFANRIINQIRLNT